MQSQENFDSTWVHNYFEEQSNDMLQPIQDHQESQRMQRIIAGKEESYHYLDLKRKWSRTIFDDQKSEEEISLENRSPYQNSHFSDNLQQTSFSDIEDLACPPSPPSFYEDPLYPDYSGLQNSQIWDQSTQFSMKLCENPEENSQNVPYFGQNLQSLKIDDQARNLVDLGQNDYISQDSSQQSDDQATNDVTQDTQPSTDSSEGKQGSKVRVRTDAIWKKVMRYFRKSHQKEQDGIFNNYQVQKSSKTGTHIRENKKYTLTLIYFLTYGVRADKNDIQGLNQRDEQLPEQFYEIYKNKMSQRLLNVFFADHVCKCLFQFWILSNAQNILDKLESQEACSIRAFIEQLSKIEDFEMPEQFTKKRDEIPEGTGKGRPKGSKKQPQDESTRLLKKQKKPQDVKHRSKRQKQK
eukprot:403376931